MDGGWWNARFNGQDGSIMEGSRGMERSIGGKADL